MIDVERFKILIVGGGRIGYRKAKTLIDSGASVTVISRELYEDFKYLDSDKIDIIKREVEYCDMDDSDIIYLATDDQELNLRLATYCINHGKMVNSVDNHENSTFINTGFFRKELDGSEVTVSVSSMGLDPSFTKKLRDYMKYNIDIADVNK